MIEKIKKESEKIKKEVSELKKEITNIEGMTYEFIKIREYIKSNYSEHYDPQDSPANSVISLLKKLENKKEDKMTKIKLEFMKIVLSYIAGQMYYEPKKFKNCVDLIGEIKLKQEELDETIK